jgi:hypothetical protein
MAAVGVTGTLSSVAMRTQSDAPLTQPTLRAILCHWADGAAAMRIMRYTTCLILRSHT